MYMLDLLCDNCGEEFPWGGIDSRFTTGPVKRAAIKEGWKFRGRKAFCPKCAEDPTRAEAYQQELKKAIESWNDPSRRTGSEK
jgi:hypothetical protein